MDKEKSVHYTEWKRLFLAQFVSEERITEKNKKI